MPPPSRRRGGPVYAGRSYGHDPDRRVGERRRGDDRPAAPARRGEPAALPRPPRGGGRDPRHGDPRGAGDRRRGGARPRARGAPDAGGGRRAARRVERHVRRPSPPRARPRSTCSGRSRGCGGASRALAGEGGETLRTALLAEALAIQQEDLLACQRMGDLGAELLPQDARILTHCNAGALATAGYGTALGVVRSAARLGKLKAVFADETRPWLQGARLTVWELMQDGIEATLIADGAAGHLMAQRRDQRGRGGRRPHRRERRRREQDRHLRRRDPGEGARPAVLRRGARLDARPPHPDRAGHPDRGAARARGDPRRRAPGGTRGHARAQPGLRRDAPPLRHRDRLRARCRAASLRGEPRRSWSRHEAARRPSGTRRRGAARRRGLGRASAGRTARASPTAVRCRPRSPPRRPSGRWRCRPATRRRCCSASGCS